MTATVGLSIQADPVFVPDTSIKLGEARGLTSPEAFDASSCSPGLASSSFHSPYSHSLVSFQELVGSAKATATDRILSTLKKSLLSHCSGFGSILASASEMSATFSESLTLTYRPSGQPLSPKSPYGEG